MNRLATQDRVHILTVLSKGMGVNAACRATGASKNTVLKLIADVGWACAVYQDRVMRNLNITQIQVGEIWSFIGMKLRNVPTDADPTLDLGDCYTFTCIDPASKLMPCWLVGFRTDECVDQFLAGLKPRLLNRVQLSTDGFGSYAKAIVKHFGMEADYAVLVKQCMPPPTTSEAKGRYSPNKLIGTTVAVAESAPDLGLATTSHAERANLSMCMGCMGIRRYTRLTNAYSKKIESHAHAIAFHFMVYNFVKVHSAVKTTPAISAGVTDIRWAMEDILMMADTVTNQSAK